MNQSQLSRKFQITYSKDTKQFHLRRIINNLAKSRFKLAVSSVEIGKHSEVKFRCGSEVIKSSK